MPQASSTRHPTFHPPFPVSAQPLRSWPLCSPYKTPLTPLTPPPPPITQPVLAAASGKRTRPNFAPTTHNRLIRHRYDIVSTYECGVELLGTEVKSIRAGKLTLRDGFARVKSGQLYLHNAHIASCPHAGKYFDHEPLRVRKLLLHKRDIRKLEQKQKEPGFTLVPTKAYFTDRGYFKIEIALARGKNERDKRADIKKRDDDREMRRVIKHSMSRL
eukprot:GFKZ01000352.1.p1 GENE.GFKZ01000352.1~~GFKZ01000352.1.p1  ORF type:complete len:216 (-),score=14.51 GFKZ01000352.1:425-1072(-)